MIDLEHTTEIPGGDAIMKGLNDFNKKAAGAMLGKIKMALLTGSDPFFRRDLGERYFTGDAGQGASAVWIGATVASHYTGTLLVLLLETMNLTALARSIDALPLPTVAGTIFVLAYMAFCFENTIRLQQFRNERKLYHSMSRGRSRWEGNTAFLILILIALALFAPILCGALIVSAVMSSKLADQQQAAIYSRYLDALDQKIESEFMEKALLGECPPEITYLSRPLSAGMNPELRQDIAAAAVGKPVGIVAQGPKRKQGATAPQPAPSDMSTAATAARPDTTASQTGTTRQPIPQTHRLTSLLKSKQFFALLAALVVVVGFSKLWMPPLQSLWAKRNQNAQSLTSQPKPVPSSVEQRMSQANSATTTPPLQPPPSRSEVDAAAQAQAAAEREREQTALELKQRQEAEAQAALEAQKRREEEDRRVALEVQKRAANQKAFEQLRVLLADESAQMAKFKAGAIKRLDDNTNRIAKVARSARKALNDVNDGQRKLVLDLAQQDEVYLLQAQNKLLALAADTNADPHPSQVNLSNSIAKMASARQFNISNLNILNSDITNAPKGGGLFNFR